MIKSADEFVQLRRSQNPEEYLRAATDGASLEIWLEIVATYPDMLIWVAHNKTVPTQVLEKLAESPSREVRIAVAMKNKLSPRLFEALSEDDDDSVRERIAYNKNTPIEILKKLTSDRCERISNRALQRLQS